MDVEIVFPSDVVRCEFAKVYFVKAGIGVLLGEVLLRNKGDVTYTT